MVSFPRLNRKHPGIKAVISHGLLYLCALDVEYLSGTSLPLFRSSLVPCLVLAGNVEEPFFKPLILSCGKLNMYKSAKGEIQTRQGGFGAYEVSGKTPLIQRDRLRVCEGTPRLQPASSVEASSDLAAPQLIRHGASASDVLPKNQARLSKFSRYLILT